MFGDNKSVVNSSMCFDAKLHNRQHTALSFHQDREDVTANIVGFYHIPGAINPADVLSKHWGVCTGVEVVTTNLVLEGQYCRYTMRKEHDGKIVGPK